MIADIPNVEIEPRYAVNVQQKPEKKRKGP